MTESVIYKYRQTFYLRDRRRITSLRWTLIVLFAVLSITLPATDHGLLMREDFEDLENWRPLTFPKIPRHTLYTIESSGESRFLKAESNASSSGLIFTSAFDVYRYPNIRWRWKVDNVYSGKDVNQVGRKNGDDYPIRVYIIFQYDPAHTGPLERITYQAAKRRYGEYPPHSALNYVWASNIESGTIMTNPYSNRSKMIFLQMGGANKGRWIEEKINILEDYQRAFGELPPATAGLAIMNDSDDTRQSSVSYIEFIEISE
ncbi:MAG: DUF3047 domain-containing protein [Spirochaetaceae bacterium]|nr:MAG: DUF3047 domain-containing protein [Spirochaetaceae bacterium]